MLPSIHDGERLHIKRFDPEGKIDVQRGDIIQFLYPDDTSKFYIKRLIALPNEVVEIREGKVVVDGKELIEPYVDSKRNMLNASEPPIKVEKDTYYVLGDNRDASSDSRSWGLVPRKNILAKVIDK
jgi:signal peptidase I